MIYIFENILAILAATIAAFAFGALYYGTLSKPWMAAARLTEEDIKGPNGKPSSVPYIISLFAEFWIASILAGALILAPVEANPWTTAIGTAIILWIGFVMPTMLVNHRYQMLPWSLTLIDAGHWLGVLTIQAFVLRLIGLEGPTS